jgi:twitching motility protein PilT
MLGGMPTRELLRQFKEEHWASDAEVEPFLAAAADVPAADLPKFLELLCAKSQEPLWIRTRCVAFHHMVERTKPASLFLPLVKALKVTDGPVRQVLMNLIPMVNNIAHHSELCALLQSSDAGVRKAAATVLGKIGGRTVFEILGKLVKQPGAQGKLETIDALALVAGHHAIPILSEVIREAEPAEKAHALKYLGDAQFIGKSVDAALEAIRLVIEAGDPRVQVDAVRSYSNIAAEEKWFEVIGPLLDSPNLAVATAAVEGLAHFGSERAAHALLRSFRVGPHTIRVIVLKVAETLGSEDVLPIFVEAINHANVTVRMSAANALSRLGLAGKVDVARAVIWLLRSRDANVRRIAIDIVGKVADASGELWPRLLRFLRDEDWWVRERVIDTLITLAGVQLTKHMLSHLSDPSDVVRRYAVRVLMRLKDPRSAGSLVRTAQNDVDWWVRESAIQAVAEIRDLRAVPHLVELMKREPQLRRVCVEALEMLEAKDAAAPMAKLLGDEEDPELRLRMMSCLAKIGDRTLADQIEKVEGDPDHRVAAKARELLRSWDHETKEIEDASSNLLDRFLQATLRAGADDLLLESNQLPYLKKRGAIEAIGSRALPHDELEALIFPLLSEAQKRELEELDDVDISYATKATKHRFRLNVFQQMHGLGAVFRVINDEIPAIDKLGLPAIARTLGDLKDGLVLVGGPTGSGKSTTLAAIIDHINRTSKRHIITLEDPIEVMHRPKSCAITLREIGTHSASFSNALRATLRQDPDVILVGELRDLPTISFAVSAAETGHLVFATVHTVSADTSIDRIINAFPAGAQPQVRSMLASSLRAVMCQYLLPQLSGGRIVAVEIMLATDAIANLIRKAKTFQIPSVIATSRELGMLSMDSELQRLVAEGLVSPNEAYMRAANKKEFELFLNQREQAAAQKPRTGSSAAIPAKRVPIQSTTTSGVAPKGKE